MSNLLPGYTLGSCSVIYFSPFIFNAIGKALALNRVKPYYTFFPRLLEHYGTEQDNLF
jgi:hypothetical protein